MNFDRNQGEKEKMYQWACDNHTEELEEKYFTKIDKTCESYFEKKLRQETYCREYHFQTMPELRSELEVMWEKDEMMEQVEKAVLVAAMKNKPRLRFDGQSKREVRTDQLSSFIYNF